MALGSKSTFDANLASVMNLRMLALAASLRPARVRLWRWPDIDPDSVTPPPPLPQAREIRAICPAPVFGATSSRSARTRRAVKQATTRTAMAPPARPLVEVSFTPRRRFAGPARPRTPK